MNDLTRLERPSQSAAKLEFPSIEPSETGFNFPTFRLLNKDSRVRLSPKLLDADHAFVYRILAVANAKGWFAAVVQTEQGPQLIFAPLSELRTAFRQNSSPFTPHRTILLSSFQPNILTFDSSETRLIVGTKQGLILIYETTSLFTQGSNDITPINTIQTSNSPPRQILANPSSEENTLVVLRTDGSIQAFNLDGIPNGGWYPSDFDSKPVSCSWSPKGKQLAIGLIHGDIVTYTLKDKATVQKHIPPTVQAQQLISLDWLSPGYSFRTAYLPANEGMGEPTHHILHLDPKSMAVSITALPYPFPLSDRPTPSAYSVTLNHWDKDNMSSSDSSLLFVTTDYDSVDVEIFGALGTQWVHLSLDNPVSLPLDSNDEDTIILAMSVDLTDQEGKSPIIYAYLNDGTVQAWRLDHSKAYAGMMFPGSAGASAFPKNLATPLPATALESPATSAFGQPPTFSKPVTPSAFGASSSPTPTFGQNSTPSSVFGQPSAFGAQSSPVFGQPSFASSSNTSAFGGGSAFGQSYTTTPSAFGSQGGSGVFGSPATSSTEGGAFGPTKSTSSSFGQGTFRSPQVPDSIEEDAMGDDTPSFDGLSLGPNNQSSVTTSKPSMFDTPSSFNNPSQPQASGSPFSSGIKPASGFGAFGGTVLSSDSPFAKAEGGGGQSAFSQPSVFEPNSSSLSPSSTFGTRSANTGTTSSSVFGNASTTQSVFGQSTFGKPASAALSSATPSTGFSAFASSGASTFGSALAAKPTFGQPGFSISQSNVPTAGSTILPSTGGFSAFAAGPSSFASAAKSGDQTSDSSVPKSGGFSAFASGTSSFASLARPKDQSSDTSTPKSDGFNSFAGNGSQSFALAPTSEAPTSVFSRPSASNSLPFSGSGDGFDGASSSASAPFRSAENNARDGSRSGNVFTRSKTPPIPHSPIQTPTPSPPSSPDLPARVPAAVPPPSPGGAFSNLKNSTAFKPASGFGAFGSAVPSDSPFAKKGNEPPKVTAFSSFALSSSTPPASVFGSKPTFGAPSALGVKPSAFGQPSTSISSTQPPSGGFSAFSGSSGGFSAFAGPPKSISELTKSTDSKRSENFETTQAEATPFSAFAPRKLMPEDAKPSQSQPTTPPQTPPQIEATKSGEKEAVDDSTVTPKHALITTPPSPTTTLTTSDREHTPVPVFSLPPADEASEKGKQKDVIEETEKKIPETSVISNDYSLESISSTGSSFVDVSKEDVEDHNAHVPDSEDDVGSDQDDDANSFLSDSVVDKSDHDDATGFSSENEEDDDLEPAQIPLPPSRSASSTPHSDTSPPLPAESSDEENDDGLESDDSGRLSTITEESESVASPNASPTKPPVSKPAIIGPSLILPSSSSNNNNMNTPMGRIGSRPSRSSPLAGAPLLSGDADDDGDQNTKTPMPVHRAKLASPKTPFEVLPMKESESVKSEPSSPRISPRPQTPPLLSSFFGGPKSLETTSTDDGKKSSPVFKTPLLPKASLVPKLTPMAPPTLNVLGKSPQMDGTSIFSTPPPLFNQTTAHFPLPSNKSMPPPPPPNMFMTPPINSSKSMPPPTPSPVAPEVILEEGMQKECLMLYLHMNRELENLRALAQRTQQQLGMLRKSSLPAQSRLTKADLMEPSKWAVCDGPSFNAVLKTYEQDLEELRLVSQGQKRSMKEIQAGMLRVGTRKEEISRFNKAKNDAEFNKMLKARTLGPEHLETQTQLRRNIRAISTRVQQLEGHLKACQKKLKQDKVGKPVFRGPSLDTVNRTYRNIDIAIKQQEKEVASVFTRLSHVTGPITPSKNPKGARDSRLPDPVHRPYTVTPHVAITTAAALNAERSAAKLKQALLAARSQPILNTQAARAPKAPVAFATPKAPGHIPTTIPLNSSMYGGMYASTPGVPIDNFKPTSQPLVSGGRIGSTSKRSHLSGNYYAKKSESPPPHAQASFFSSPSPAPKTQSFNWGPLPNFGTPVASSFKPLPGFNLFSKPSGQQ